MNLVPLIASDGTIVDGQYIKALSFCKANCAIGKCAEFYKSLFEKDIAGFYTCPHGMSCYLSIVDGQTKTIYSCFREKATYNKTKAKALNQIKENVYNPVLHEDQLLSLIDATNDLYRQECTLVERTSAVESISHEVKKLNSQIKERSDLILQSYRLIDDDVILSTDNLQRLQEDIRTIFISSSMVASRFSLYDYEKNPDVLSQGAIFDCNVYKKFDKIKRILKNYQKRGIVVNINGSSYDYIEAYPSFELIPLLLVENAVKYSYASNSVEIGFAKTTRTSLSITIDSYSPYCSDTEITHLFQKGFRGKEAKKVSSDGSGVGLYFVKLICDLHKVKISVSSNKDRRATIDGIVYAPFQVKLEFDNTYSI